MDKKSFRGRQQFIGLLEENINEAFTYGNDLIHLKNEYTLTFTESTIINAINVMVKALSRAMGETQARILNG